jgi:multidrug efflux system outer membrane protein
MKRLSALLALLASGCVSMEPKYVRPDAAIPASWPVGDPYLVQSEAALPAVSYKDIFRDPRLQTLIEQALINNRDLMVSVANIEAARAQFQIQRAQQFPQVDANAGVTLTGDRGGSGSGSGSGSAGSGKSGKSVTAQYSAGLSVPNFELDLFGRLRSLSHAQFARYLATEAAARATRLTLVANIANGWLDYAADSSLLTVSQDTAAAAAKSVQLTQARVNAGIAARTDLVQAEQILDTAQADVANQRTLVAQDVNALQLLVGAPIDPKLLSPSIDEASPTITELPPGLSSYVLLRRPDVVEAEYDLRAANANIGAARAALFPKITLTGLLGFASSALTSLFTGGAFGWSTSANAAYTIFNAGAGRANVRLSQAQKEAAVATYQRAIQSAFRDVADALARRGTMGDQLAARQRQDAAAAEYLRLSEARYKAGVDNYLATLDAQRSYYSARQLLVQTKLTAAQNLVNLYQALGGDPLLQTAPVQKSPLMSNQ